MQGRATAPERPKNELIKLVLRMKILYKSRLVDIKGFHAVMLSGSQLIISYPFSDSGILLEPDVFVFDYERTAQMVLRHINRYCATDRIIEIFETKEGRTTVTAHHDHGNK